MQGAGVEIAGGAAELTEQIDRRITGGLVMGRPVPAFDEATFDYVVIGGGTAGCVVAARLAERGDGNVCLLEAGDDHAFWLQQRVPVGCFYLLRGSRALWRFVSVPQAGAGGRQMVLPRGRIVGGSSSINGMIWVVGDPAEYDQWAADGCKNWDYRSISGCLDRVQDLSGHRPGRHGEGMVPIRIHTPRDRLTEAFLDACAETGIARTDNYNDGSYSGAGYLQFNTWRGLRYGARETYLRSVRHRRNFRLTTQALAESILFEGKRAVGVLASVKGTACTFRARRQVVLCAGTFGSPQLLEKSGVGAPELISALGRPVVAASPSVGENLRDHYSVRLMAEARGLATLNRAVHSFAERARLAARYLLHGDGMLSTVSATAHALTPSRSGETRPALKLQLHHFTSPNARSGGAVAIDRWQGFSISAFVLRPRSTGSVHVDPAAPDSALVVDPGYLGNDQDLAETIRGVRLIRRLLRAPSLARCVEREVRPESTLDSDEELADFVRNTGQTSYHPVGTCRMGADADSVVDVRLRVRGVEGLRVIDASVMPTLPSSNTHAPTILVAERGAEMLIEDAAGAAAPERRA
jgi:choline dehydrogenase